MGIKGTAHPSASQPLSLCSVISFTGSLYLCLSFSFFSFSAASFALRFLLLFSFFSYYLQMFDKGLLPPSSPLSVLLFLCQPHCVSWTKPTNSEHLQKEGSHPNVFRSFMGSPSYKQENSHFPLYYHIYCWQNYTLNSGCALLKIAEKNGLIYRQVES